MSTHTPFTFADNMKRKYYDRYNEIYDDFVRAYRHITVITETRKMLMENTKLTVASEHWDPDYIYSPYATARNGKKIASLDRETKT